MSLGRILPLRQWSLRSLSGKSFPYSSIQTGSRTIQKATQKHGTRKAFSTSSPPPTSIMEGTLLYDQVSKQPLMLTVFSLITTTSFVVLEVTRKDTPDDSPFVIKVFGSWIWNYVGTGLGLVGIFLSTKYPKFLVSEVRLVGRKVYLRTHTIIGHKGPQKVFDLSDLIRIKSTSNDYVNWKSLSTPRRFVLNRTDEIEQLVPFGFSTSVPTDTASSGSTLSNVGGKTVTEAKLYEKALKERWTKRSKPDRK